jgi:hypothetical protein
MRGFIIILNHEEDEYNGRTPLKPIMTPLKPKKSSLDFFLKAPVGYAQGRFYGICPV